MKTSTAPLSPAMKNALLNGAQGNFAGCFETGRHTERALIARGLANPVYGITTRRNPYSRFAQTVYDAYLGIEFTDKGREVAAQLLAEGA